MNELPRNLTDVEVAAHLCISVSVVRKWRGIVYENGSHAGPPFLKLGGCVRYPRVELEVWEKQQQAV